ncbi:MAG TPA: AI-2E family transporter [Candidatus Angelobacter sp.]|nr:AI-2E family transporter [Candidatus Angelobacter sp.]
MNERLRSYLILLTVIVGLIVAWLLREVVLLIYLSVIFAVIFTPVVKFFEKIKVGRWSPGRGAAILIVLAIVAVAMTIFIVVGLPPVLSDSQDLAAHLPERIRQLQDRLYDLPFGHFVASKINAGSLEKYTTEAIANVFSVFKGVAGGITAFLTFALLTAYFILDGQRSFDWILSMVPARNRTRLAATLSRAAARAQRWLTGQFLLMLILGGSSAIVFGLLGVRYFYALALFAGLANFVPILGPIATVIIAGLVALLDSPMKLLGVVIFYAVYQQVENAFLTPRIMKSSVELPPVAVVLALAIGGAAAGVAGAMVAVPTAAIFATLADEYLVRRDPKTPQKMQAA